MFGSLRLSNTIKDDMGHAPNKFTKIGLDHMEIELKTVQLSLAIEGTLERNPGCLSRCFLPSSWMWSFTFTGFGIPVPWTMKHRVPQTHLKRWLKPQWRIMPNQQWEMTWLMLFDFFSYQGNTKTLAWSACKFGSTVIPYMFQFLENLPTLPEAEVSNVQGSDSRSRQQQHCTCPIMRWDAMPSFHRQLLNQMAAAVYQSMGAHPPCAMGV